MLEAHPNFSKTFSFDFMEFSMIKLFNIQQIFHSRSRHYETTLVHPYSSKAFQWYQEHGKGHRGLENLNMTNFFPSLIDTHVILK